MGYFSNNTEADIYQRKYCFQCIRWKNEIDCPIWQLHELFNYEHCNKADSFLHKLIPKRDGRNGKCLGYIEGELPKTDFVKLDMLFMGCPVYIETDNTDIVARFKVFIKRNTEL